MQVNKHIYTFNYEEPQSELCKLESRLVFDQEEKNKQLFSDVKIEPSSSAYIKRRIDVISFSEDYFTLIDNIKKANICIEGFKVEYVVLEDDSTEYDERLKKLRDVGFSINGYPDYYNPTIMYGLCVYEGIWYFGILVKDDFDWYKHNKKPRSFSNSIGMSVAKALVCIATKGNLEKTLIDACCGVGTIMLEACFTGYNIEGCDINWKACRDTRENLAHFNYKANVHLSDIKNITGKYDAGIIDLPYNLYSCATDEDVLHIIKSTAELTNRLVIVSISDISEFIEETGFKLLEHCSVTKKGRANFARRIWVCEKEIY